MGKKQTLTAEQRQRLRLAPLQLQLVPLLTMNAPEIEEEVRRELEDNPALEVAGDDDVPQPQGEEAGPAQDNDDNKEDSFESLNDGDDDMPLTGYQARNRSADDEYYTPTVVAETSLSEHLMGQLQERDLSEEELLVAEYIVGNLDSNGYLQRTPAAIADDVTFKGGLEVETEDVNEVLKVVRQLDPPGIAAQNLRECLLLQIDRKPKVAPFVQLHTLVDRYLDELGHRQFGKICDGMGITEQELSELNKALQQFNPKPGSAFSGGASEQHSQQITPDFEVNVEGNSISFTLLNRIPELQISETYSNAYTQLSGKSKLTGSQAVQATDVRQNYMRASDFIQVLRQRQEKLFLTMKSIIARQREFFLTGDEANLEPMILKDISEDTGIDQSVISRVTQQKYVTTPWGVFKLRYFFSEGLSGGDVSSKEVQACLKKLVDNEDKRHPLSDDRLVKLLKEQGYTLARRTVAKYRGVLGIAESRLRKQL